METTDTPVGTPKISTKVLVTLSLDIEQVVDSITLIDLNILFDFIVIITFLALRIDNLCFAISLDICLDLHGSLASLGCLLAGHSWGSSCDDVVYFRSLAIRLALLRGCSSDPSGLLFASGIR